MKGSVTVVRDGPGPGVIAGKRLLPGHSITTSRAQFDRAQANSPGFRIVGDPQEEAQARVEAPPEAEAPVEAPPEVEAPVEVPPEVEAPVEAPPEVEAPVEAPPEVPAQPEPKPKPKPKPKRERRRTTRRKKKEEPVAEAVESEPPEGSENADSDGEWGPALEDVFAGEDSEDT